MDYFIKKMEEKNNMENKYTWREVLEEAKSRLSEGQLLEDNSGTQWDIYNLMDCEGEQTDDERYYCVGYDGRIGFTKDNGYNVEWLYTVIE